MRKVLLFTVLLLTLAVVLTTPIAAKKGGPGPPERGDEKVVEFTGDISSESTVTMIFHKKGGSIRFYNKNEDLPIQLYFSEEEGKFDRLNPPVSGFPGWQPSWNIVVKMKEGKPPEATTWIDFGILQPKECNRQIAPYQLRGFGTFELEGTYTDGTYKIILTDTAIYDVKYVPSRSKGCKGAWGKEYINPRRVDPEITFWMAIQGK